MLLTLCMIVRDEADDLADCLASARAAVDEIVVVDTGSADRSREVARAHGAVIVDVPWQDDFAAARNASLDRAHGKWVLVLDADERLAGDAPGLRRWLRRTPAIAAQVQIRNLLGGDREERHSAIRLFRRVPGARYERKLHEQIVGSILAHHPEGRIYAAPISIVHLGYLPEIVAKRGKRERNARLAEAEVAERPQDPFAAYALGVEYVAQQRLEEGLREFSRARTLTPDVEPWQTRLYKVEAGVLLHLGRQRDALRLALKGLRHFPRFTDLHYLAGVLLARTGRPVDAERHLRRAIALGPAQTPPHDGVDPRLGGAQAWRMLGTLLGELRRHDEASSALRQAVQLEPGDLGHVQALLEHHLAQGRDPAELWREPPPGALQVAAGLWRLRRYQDALAAFAEARVRQPSLPSQLGLLEALCHAHLHAAPQALRTLRAVLPLPPGARRDVFEQAAWAVGLRDTQELAGEQGLRAAIAMLAADLAPLAGGDLQLLEGITPSEDNPSEMAQGEGS